MVEHARVEALNHWFIYNEKMPIESISLSVSQIALSFADKESSKSNTKKRVSRPFGCSLLLAGIDKGESYLYRNGVLINKTLLEIIRDFRLVLLELERKMD